MTLGPMEATAEVIAEINEELAGFQQTRTTLPVAEGDLIVPVESADNWPDSGSFLMFGTIYTYAARTATTLEAITWTDGETIFNGARADLQSETIVTDLSRATSAMDLLRRAMLVDTADAADLNVVGRNLGVLRLPFLIDDARFRELIRALAYNPRGTVYGIELVLTALLGAGNFEIFEDVVSFPNRVFIRISEDLVVGTGSDGKTWLRGGEIRPSDSASQVTVNETVLARGSVTSVRLAPEARLTDCRTQYPTADSLVEYTGGPTVNPWIIFGTSVVEGTHITQVTPITTENGAVEFTLDPPVDTSVYGHLARMGVDSEAESSILVTVPTAGANEGSVVSGMTLDDGVKQGLVGVQAVAGGWDVGLAAFGSNFLGTPVNFPRDEYHDIALRKVRDVRWELYIDGKLVETAAYSAMAATSGLGTGPAFGKYAIIGSSSRMRVKQAGYRVRDPVDYWGIRATDGVMVNPDILQSATGAFTSADVGKQIVTRDTLGSNPENTGVWEIYQFDSANQVRVRGRAWPGRADLGNSPFPLVRVEVDATNPDLFEHPQDVGKLVEIFGSTLGNNGSYSLQDVLQPGTDKFFATDFDTQTVPERSNVVLVSGATFTPEQNVGFRLNPNFSAVGSTYWEMPDAGSEASSVLTLRSPSSLPHPTVVEVLYSFVLGGNLLFDSQVLNARNGALLDYYPFYFTDPIGFIRQYLDDVTAAGVIPDYQSI